MICNTDTLAYFKNRPTTKMIDYSSAEVSVVAERIRLYRSQSDHVQPESQAIEFYMLNHAAALIAHKFEQDEPLPPPYLQIMQEYQVSLAEISTRVFAYMLLINTRETRHINGSVAQSSDVKSPACNSFTSGIKGKGSSGAVDRFLAGPPNASLGKYTRHMRSLFFNGSWSSAYGGKAWGEVCDVLTKYVLGEYSAEMMVDTVWTLAHNTGPIFNKGMFYSKQNNSSLLRILDLQRAGQLPQAIHADSEVNAYVNSRTHKLHQQCAQLFPLEFTGLVDWQQVVALGAVGNYQSEVKKQKATQPEAAPHTHATPKTEHSKLEVMPGIYATITPREAA